MPAIFIHRLNNRNVTGIKSKSIYQIFFKNNFINLSTSRKQLREKNKKKIKKKKNKSFFLLRLSQ